MVLGASRRSVRRMDSPDRRYPAVRPYSLSPLFLMCAMTPPSALSIIAHSE